MIIQHNIMALNSYNRLSGNNSLVSKNLEKLSSGYKINRAGDDAAGLAISEKMRAQITGLTRATQNSQDGISLVQTAEGQLTEVHSMLNRMVDLATQASNGTIDNDTDRANLQKEVDSLKAEINRIAENSHFNGIKLLDGSMGGYAMTSAQTGTTVDSDSFKIIGGSLNGQDKFVVGAAGAGGKFEVTSVTLGGVTLTAGQFATSGITVTATNPADLTKAGSYTLKITVSDATKASKAVSDAIGEGITLTFNTTKTAAANDAITMTADGTAGKAADNAGLNLQIGDDKNQRVTVKVQNMNVTSLNLDAVDVSNETNAADSIKMVKDAINTVSGTRADLGAIQNRLEHTINNLTTTTENMTAAESRIRDTDMAKEMMAFTKNNVLSQAAQAMLAQANQQPQQVLQLLR